jgi:hypothetical protein
VIAAPWFIRWYAMKGDPFDGQSGQSRPGFCFMRAITNIDAELFRLNQRLDHGSQHR